MLGYKVVLGVLRELYKGERHMFFLGFFHWRVDINLNRQLNYKSRYLYSYLIYCQDANPDELNLGYEYLLILAQYNINDRVSFRSSVCYNFFVNIVADYHLSYNSLP